MNLYLYNFDVFSDNFFQLPPQPKNQLQLQSFFIKNINNYHPTLS